MSDTRPKKLVLIAQVVPECVVYNSDVGMSEVSVQRFAAVRDALLNPIREAFFAGHPHATIGFPIIAVGAGQIPLTVLSDDLPHLHWKNLEALGDKGRREVEGVGSEADSTFDEALLNAGERTEWFLRNRVASLTAKVLGRFSPTIRTQGGVLYFCGPANDVVALMVDVAEQLVGPIHGQTLRRKFSGLFGPGILPMSHSRAVCLEYWEEDGEPEISGSRIGEKVQMGV